jgi:peptidyl-dipeptidase A
MDSTIESFVAEVTRQARPLEKAYTLAEWQAATNGTPEAIRAQQDAQTAHVSFWADPDRLRTAKELMEADGVRDALLARQLRLIYLTAASNQHDEATLQEIAQVEAEVRDRYVNVRGQVDGRSLTDNEIDEILRSTSDSAEARRVWEASKQVGVEVADRIRQLARLRNRSARAHGFRDHFHRALVVSEVDEGPLLEIFDDLERQSRRPFEDLKASIDHSRARRFGLTPDELRPWHYSDRFFQKPDPLGEVDLEGLYAGHDPVPLATTTYDGLGIDVRPVLARSDLYARTGKNQHAFCTHIDRDGDIRTLNNLQPNERWIETLHHELGHAVYEMFLDPALPWLLRAPAHILSTEAIAVLMGGVPREEEWLTGILGVPAADAAHVAAAASERDRASQLVFTRWCLVMTHFERQLYADPERDLDGLWWDLVERYQRVRRPDGRRLPDWAAKIHVALFPVYYHNYELGGLMRFQLRACLQRQTGGLVGRPEAGAWLIEHVFRPGARLDWAQHIAAATGEPLTPKYFVEAMN